jgi:hypothetical protein
MNQIYTHPGQDQMQAEVILASKGPDQKPIYTIRLRYPRIIHGEIMTHRVFSRNARSSRAVPVKTMLNEVRNTPFIPWHWGKNQKGMQANEECDELLFVHEDDDHWNNREDAWLLVRDRSADIAEAYMNAGYHKQIPNRLLEPYSWIDTLITSTEWDNFLWLRDHADAEPHLQDLARLVKVAIENAKVWDLKPGEWHLPYIKPEEDFYYARKWMIANGGSAPDYKERLLQTREILCKVSAARCAWISYKPFGGGTNSNFEREMKTFDMLMSSDRVHASPLEHQATPDEKAIGSMDLFLKDNKSLSPDITLDAKDVWIKQHLHGNLSGYIQFRKTIPNEAKTEGSCDPHSSHHL